MQLLTLNVQLGVAVFGITCKPKRYLVTLMQPMLHNLTALSRRRRLWNGDHWSLLLTGAVGPFSRLPLLPLTLKLLDSLCLESLPLRSRSAVILTISSLKEAFLGLFGPIKVCDRERRRFLLISLHSPSARRQILRVFCLFLTILTLRSSRFVKGPSIKRCPTIWQQGHGGRLPLLLR